MTFCARSSNPRQKRWHRGGLPPRANGARVVTRYRRQGNWRRAHSPTSRVCDIFLTSIRPPNAQLRCRNLPRTECITSRRGLGMSSVDHYRAKAEELKAKSQSEDSAISKAVFEGLAQSYIRLARLEENHQREVRQKAWAHSASETGWSCACGHSISWSEREVYFTTRRCMHCNQVANERLSRLYDLASASHFGGLPADDRSARSHWMLAASKFFGPLLGRTNRQKASRRLIV
jgi:RNA polymerase-binding transcription factor DksA